MRSASFHRLAECELTDAAQFYELEMTGLGAAFLTEVERSLDDVLAHPEAGSPLGGGVRRRLLRRFPYAILYAIKPDQVRILAIMNLRRRPSYWTGRS